MANELGAGGRGLQRRRGLSAFGNARQNGLTPFRFDSVTVPQPGQVVYIRDLDTARRTRRASRRSSARTRRYEVAYEPGVATFARRRGDLANDYVVFVPPDFPGDMRLLTLANHGAKTLRLRVAPFFDIALGESPNESAGNLNDRDASTRRCCSRIRATISNAEPPSSRRACSRPTTETIRTRFFGAPGRNIATPVLVETGASDGSQSDDGRRVAAFAGEIDARAGRRGEDRDRHRSGGDARGRPRRGRSSRSRARPRRELAATRASWAQAPGRGAK